HGDQVNIIEAIIDQNLFGNWFKGDTWRAWIAFLCALFGLPLTDEQAAIFRKHTGRNTTPSQQVREAWLVVGRRGGKSLMAALVAVFLACFREYGKFLGPGERPTVMVIAADR